MTNMRYAPATDATTRRNIGFMTTLLDPLFHGGGGGGGKNMQK